MGHGYPPLAPAAEAGLRISLSVDVEIIAACDMFTQMRAAYQAARHGQSSAGGTPSVTVRQILRADRPDVAPVLDPYSTVVLQMDRSRVDTVLVAGRPVKRSGVDLSDSTGLLTEAREAAERLLSLPARQGG